MRPIDRPSEPRAITLRPGPIARLANLRPRERLGQRPRARSARLQGGAAGWRSPGPDRSLRGLRTSGPMPMVGPASSPGRPPVPRSNRCRSATPLRPSPGTALCAGSSGVVASNRPYRNPGEPPAAARPSCRRAASWRLRPTGRARRHDHAGSAGATAAGLEAARPGGSRTGRTDPARSDGRLAPDPRAPRVADGRGAPPGEAMHPRHRPRPPFREADPGRRGRGRPPGMDTHRPRRRSIRALAATVARLGRLVLADRGSRATSRCPQRARSPTSSGRLGARRRHARHVGLARPDHRAPRPTASDGDAR